MSDKLSKSKPEAPALIELQRAFQSAILDPRGETPRFVGNSPEVSANVRFAVYTEAFDAEESPVLLEARFSDLDLALWPMLRPRFHPTLRIVDLVFNTPERRRALIQNDPRAGPRNPARIVKLGRLAPKSPAIVSLVAESRSAGAEHFQPGVQLCRGVRGFMRVARRNAGRGQRRRVFAQPDPRRMDCRYEHEQSD